MKIAEMEAHFHELAAVENQIADALRDRRFADVFSASLNSLPHIVPAIKYRKKRDIQPETPTLLSLRAICRYGPPLFEHAVLQQLLDFVTSTRMLARHEKGYTQKVEAAIAREEAARLLWNQLQSNPGFLQRDIRKSLGVDQDAAVEVVEVWEELSIVMRVQEANSYLVYFQSHLDEHVYGTCQNCGVRGKTRKHVLFKPIKCPKCEHEDYFHISCS